jgi:hypothetical protein
MRRWSDIMDFLTETAKGNLQHDGELLPVLFIEGDDNAIVGIRGLGRTSEERQTMLFLLGLRMASLNPQRVSMVTDAYIKADTDGRLPIGSLADDPDAEECISVVSQDRKGRTRAVMVKYERYPTLEGTRIEMKDQEKLSKVEPFLLMAFWRGAGIMVRQAR